MPFPWIWTEDPLYKGSRIAQSRPPPVPNSFSQEDHDETSMIAEERRRDVVKDTVQSQYQSTRQNCGDLATFLLLSYHVYDVHRWLYQFVDIYNIRYNNKLIHVMATLLLCQCCSIMNTDISSVVGMVVEQLPYTFNVAVRSLYTPKNAVELP